MTASLLKSPGLLSIDLNNAVVWMASARPPISNSSILLTKLLVIVPSVPITTGITVTFMFYNFFSSLTMSKCTVAHQIDGCNITRHK